MSEPFILTYSTGLILAALWVIGALGTTIILRRKHRLRVGSKIILHIIQTAFWCALALTARHYFTDALNTFHLQHVSQRVIDFSTVAIVALIIIWQLFLLIDLFEHHQIAKGSDPTSARLVSRILKISLFLLLVLMFGEHLGISVSGLLAFGGVGGIIIGMASKDLLSNLLSGIMLFYDRRFNIGDWISSPDRDIEGTVVEMGWRITKIMTFEQRPLYIPNSLFSTISVENPGRMTNRRIKTTLTLRYEDAGKVGKIVEHIRTMIENHSAIDQSKTLLVYFDAFGDSSLDILVYCFTKTTVWAKWLEAQQDVYLKIIDIVHANGADFAFPTQTLFFANNQDPTDTLKNPINTNN